MQKLKLVILLAFAGVVNSFAQCPIAGFNVNDTVCAGISFSLTNTSTGASSYQWDFCPNDLDSVPTGINIGNPGTAISAPQQIKLVKDNGNYYLFIANYVNANILRIDFGPDLANTTPTTFSYTGFVNPIGVDVAKDGNTWYALLTDNGNNHLYRINLGDTIGNNIYSNTDLGLVNFNQPKFIKIMKDNADYYAFVTNIVPNLGNYEISKIKFGSSLGNAILDSTLFTDLSFSAPWGIDFAFDCLSNKYVGFIANNNTGKISVVDFGNSLANPGSVDHTIGPLPEFPAGINILKDGDDWHLMVAGPSDFTLQQLNFGNDILNSNPTTLFNGNIGSLSNPRGISFIRDSSRWYGLIGNASGNTLTSIKYENNCAVNIPYSEDSLPLNVFYTGGGWQYINLMAENNGFVNSHTDSVYVEFAPQVNFSHSAACSGQPVNFNDLTIVLQGTISSWQWDFGDGTPFDSFQNPVHSYTIDSSYLVTLTVTGSSGCIGTFSDSITIHGNPNADFSFTDSICSGTSIPFTDTSIPASSDSITAWDWDFGDGTSDTVQNPVHIFDTAGTYNVQVIVYGSSGCSDSSEQIIHIKPAPVANFSVSQTCIGENTLFTNNTQGTGTINYVWNFGDGITDNTVNPSHTYLAIDSSYAVMLVASSANGCSDTLLQNVHISTRANPGFIFLPDTACAGNIIQFIDTSTVAAGDTIAFSTWDFNDGSGLATGDTVTHIFALSGPYNVTLTVTSLTSCDTSITKTITVIDGPTANFLFNNVCLSNQSIFVDTSTTPAGTTIDSVLWDFGDGTNPDTGSTATHIYAAYGSYTVTETVFNNNGCSGTVSKVVTVFDEPVASFTYNSFICTGTEVCFTNLSTVNNDSIIAYVWNFGDAQGSTLENPCHIYNVGGNYSVTLNVTSSHGCNGNTLQPLIVNTAPLFNFSDSLHCFGDSTHFTYHSLIIPDLANTWTWNFGDGNSSFVYNPVHLYDSAGVYNVMLIVSAINGCSVTDSQIVTISPKPSAGILSDSAVCFGNELTFLDNSSISSGTIDQWTWNFGDSSSTVNTQNTSYNYSQDGTYIVSHTVVSDSGCSSTTTQSILVAPPPVASFIPDPVFGSPPLPVQFLNTSNGAASYQWDFGDNNMSTSVSPSHTYADTGLYNACLIAIDIYGCADTVCESISALVPYLDLGIKTIHATQLNDLLSISADLINLGNIAINKFQISAETENGSPVNEQWESTDPLKAGASLTYIFTARYEIDPLNIPSFFCVEISEMNDTTDAVEANNKKCSAINDEFQVFGIFPNPSNDNVQIGMNVPAEGTIDINFYDAAGRLVKHYAGLAVGKGYNRFSYSIRNFAKGFYACTVQFRDDVLVKKIIKK